VLTWNSLPTGVPSVVKRWPWTLRKLVSVPLLPVLSQTTTKSPAWFEATKGRDWLEVV
jgi:hypothetical protein